MKKNYLKLISSFLMAALFITGCQKDLKETSPEADLQSAKGKPKNECRLTNLTFPFGEYNYHYNSQGLCDEWDISDYGLFKQEYNANGRLIKSKLYDGTNLIYTIHFFYEGNKVVKEIWYDGNTTNVIDEVIYSYNVKGQMVRGESFMNDYYTIETWTPEGNTATWDFFIGGNPFYTGIVTYTQPIKNPYLAIPGIEYGFPFINPTYNQSKWSNAGEKIIIYDENGDPFVLSDYDPLQTTWQVGHQNYPLSTNFFDLVSQEWFSTTFEYENCEPGNVSGNSPVTKPSLTATGKINRMMLLKRNSSKSIKEQAKEIRRQLIK
ncbi:MAG: hypothetical protein ABIO79_00150 [Ferruginibacter sp.]